ncbi:MAG: TadE/TadG family type IV pilus assembly protein [Acidobacteriaceae bacterium]
MRCERGSAMVEFALVLPLFLLLVTGIFSFGIALNNYLTLTDAVSVGAQYLAVSRANTTNPCADAASAIYNAAPYLNPSKLGLTFVLGGTSYGAFTGAAATTCSSGSSSTGAAGNLVQGQSAEVIATYPCTLAVYGYNFACNLHAQITEIVQ